MAVNVKGSFFVAQAAISRLRNGGRIINLSSALSRHPYPRMAAYSMGKAAINHFTVNLAVELGKRGITVNAIGPGLTATDFTAHARQDPNVVQQVSAHTALGRLGEAEDIAGVAAWLASDDARWVTGQYIEASGGIGLGMSSSVLPPGRGWGRGRVSAASARRANAALPVPGGAHSSRVEWFISFRRFFCVKTGR